MKLKQIILMAALTMATAAAAQSLHSEEPSKLSDGILNLKLGNTSNSVRIGGFISADGHVTEVKNDNNENGFNVGHAFFNIEGSFLNDKLGFFLQTDFSLNYPLLDAYATWKPVPNLVLTAGQKQTFTNSRDMMLRDQMTSFGAQHSHMSRAMNETGRELGLFVEYRLPVKYAGLDLGIAVTSGDGRNSFGSSSTDSDKGGLKYGARATFYPLGYFHNSGELVFHDFARESTPKIAIGGAFSYNRGASNKVGEGHGDFTMHNAEGEECYPDYRKLSADIMMKWQGFTLLVDWQNTTATELEKLYTSASAASKLKPEQISEYLALGNGVDVQAGYLFPSLWAVDAAWSFVKPEFDETDASALAKMSSYDVGVSKYLSGNTVKLQLAFNYTKYRTQFMRPYKNRSINLNMQIMF